MSLRDRIIEADDIGKELLEVPQWDITLEMRTMSAIQRSRMLQVCTKDDGNVDLDQLYPMLCIATVFDPTTGEQVFSEEDIGVLQEKSAAALEFVATRAMEMSGMTATAVDDEGKGS